MEQLDPGADAPTVGLEQRDRHRQPEAPRARAARVDVEHAVALAGRLGPEGGRWERRELIAATAGLI